MGISVQKIQFRSGKNFALWASSEAATPRGRMTYSRLLQRLLT
jgi:hypothetical protein